MLLSLLCTLVMTSSSGVASRDVELHVIGLSPVTGAWHGGAGILPASLMGVDYINNDPSVLPGYKLRLWYNDTQVLIVLICYTD